MMSDLEKDVASIWEMLMKRFGCVTSDDIARQLHALGYTRTGLTDAQREVVDELRKYKANRSKTPVCVVDRILMAFMDGDTITPPEPPKPERKMQRWEVTCCHWMDVKSLVAEGWEPYAVCPNVDEHPSHYLKRPIPGDAA